MLSIYLLTWLGVMAAQISPGPNVAAVASVELAQGRRPALYVVVGISSGMLVWSAATALGLGALIEAYPLSLLLMKFLGGGYLLLLGVKAAWKTFKGGGNAIFAPDARPSQMRLLGVGAFWSYSPIPKLHLCGPRSHLSFLVKD